MDLNKIFGKYAGQTLLDPNRKTVLLDYTLLALEGDAIKHGLFLRMNWDGQPAQHPNPKRLNVNVETRADGKIYIKPDFHLG